MEDLDTSNSPCIDHGRRGDKDGYDKRGHGRTVQFMHRIVYCKSHSLDILDIAGQVVRHSCDNRRCINPDHLLLGTQLENLRDMAVRRRVAGTKLTVDQVAEIRRVCTPGGKNNPHSYSAMARKFKVSTSAVRSAFHRIYFSHLP